MKIDSLVKTVCILFLACLCVGCGGGSKGTGGETFKGHVVTGEGTPLPKVSVILPEFGDETVTDAQGRFSMETQLSGDTVQVLLEGADFSVTIYIDDVPPGTKEIIVTFAVLRHDDFVAPSVQAIEFR